MIHLYYGSNRTQIATAGRANIMDRGEKCALLTGDSDFEDVSKGKAEPTEYRIDGKSCLSYLVQRSYTLVVVLIALQVVLIVFFLRTNGKVQELQLELTALKEKEECNKTEQKAITTAGDENKHLGNKLENQQEKSLSNTVLPIDKTMSTATELISVRADMVNVKSVIANLTSTISILEENLSSQIQKVDRDLSRMILKLSDEMGLPHSHPNSMDLKTTPFPPVGPHPQGSPQVPTEELQESIPEEGEQSRFDSSSERFYSMTDSREIFGFGESGSN